MLEPVATFRCRVAVGIVCGWLVICVFAPPVANARLTSDQARTILRDDHKLRLEEGVWMAPLERQVRRRLKMLPQMQGQVRQAEASFRSHAGLTARNNSVLLARQQAIEAEIQLRRAQLRQPLTDGQRRVVAAQIDERKKALALIQRQAVAPEELCRLPILRQQLVEITNRRNDLAIALLWIHEQRPLISALYETLQANGQIASALKQLGDDAVLGPAEDYDGERLIRLLRRFEKTVFNSHLPLYGQGDALRVSGLVGQTPVTFTWKDTSDPPLIPATVIERANLVLPKPAKVEAIVLENGRRVKVQRFRIAYLRFGEHVLQDVEALALPADAEDAGARIGPNAFAGLTAKAEPERFQLSIRPR